MRSFNSDNIYVTLKNHKLMSNLQELDYNFSNKLTKAYLDNFEKTSNKQKDIYINLKINIDNDINIVNIFNPNDWNEWPAITPRTVTSIEVFRMEIVHNNRVYKVLGVYNSSKEKWFIDIPGSNYVEAEKIFPFWNDKDTSIKYRRWTDLELD